MGPQTIDDIRGNEIIFEVIAEPPTEPTDADPPGGRPVIADDE